MKINIIKSVFLVSMVLFALGCENKKSLRQEFENDMETNIEACAKPFIAKGVDSTKAFAICRCVLNNIFEMDSTIMFEKNHKKLEEFMINNQSALIKRCPELQEIMKQNN